MTFIAFLKITIVVSEPRNGRKLRCSIIIYSNCYDIVYRFITTLIRCNVGDDSNKAIITNSRSGNVRLDRNGY